MGLWLFFHFFSPTVDYVLCTTAQVCEHALTCASTRTDFVRTQRMHGNTRAHTAVRRPCVVHSTLCSRALLPSASAQASSCDRSLSLTSYLPLSPFCAAVPHPIKQSLHMHAMAADSSSSQDVSVWDEHGSEGPRVAASMVLGPSQCGRHIPGANMQRIYKNICKKTTNSCAE